MFTTRLVTDRAELEEVFRFRFEVYTAELGQQFPDAVMRSGRIEEPADAPGHVLAAYAADGQLAGTLRFNTLRQGIPDPYADIFAEAGLTVADPTATTISSRFVVRQKYRCSTVSGRLMAHGYRAAWECGSRWDLITAPRHVAELYPRLGYRPLRSEVAHPTFGPCALLELDMTADTPFRRLALRGVAS
jgi:GNAT superfamily N-acetyltransferase